MTYAAWLETVIQTLQNRLNLPRDEARARARLLLDRAAGQRHAHLLLPDEELSPEQDSLLKDALEEAAQGWPLPYITGRIEFYGREFRCDQRGLIPRPETELLVEAALARLQGEPAVKIADLGTGSGCIAVTLALELPMAWVFATDVSPEARALAQENARHLRAQVELLPGRSQDWAAPLRRLAPFNALVSNPPYIATAEIETLQPEIRLYEPRLALDGGEDGLDSYRLLAWQCRGLLAEDGFLALELGAGQWEPVRVVFEAQGWEVELPVYDLQGHARVLVARPGGKTAPVEEIDFSF